MPKFDVRHAMPARGFSRAQSAAFDIAHLHAWHDRQNVAIDGLDALTPEEVAELAHALNEHGLLLVPAQVEHAAPMLARSVP